SAALWRRVPDDGVERARGAWGRRRVLRPGHDLDAGAVRSLVARVEAGASGPGDDVVARGLVRTRGLQRPTRVLAGLRARQLAASGVVPGAHRHDAAGNGVRAARRAADDRLGRLLALRAERAVREDLTQHVLRAPLVGLPAGGVGARTGRFRGISEGSQRALIAEGRIAGEAGVLRPGRGGQEEGAQDEGGDGGE